MDSFVNSGANALHNKSVGLDSAMLMSLLIELLNSKPNHCKILPEFRIEQLIKMVTRKISPVSERKVLESTGALYCLSLYFALSTIYSKSYTFKFVSLLQSVLSEIILVMNTFGGSQKIHMPKIMHALIKDNAINIDYKLEVFTEAFDLAKSASRDLYSLMKIVFRVGRRGAHSTNYTPDEKRKQQKYAETVQPYSLYFMCVFGYSHIAVVLKAANNLNIYPGMLEAFTMLKLSTTKDMCQQMAAAYNESHQAAAGTAAGGATIGGGGKEALQYILDNSTVAAPGTLRSPTSTTSAAAAPAVDGGPNSAAQAPAAPAASAAPVAGAGVVKKIGYQLMIEHAHKLASFVAHIIFDTRSLQEVRKLILSAFYFTSFILL
jgi:hypothetical protein